MRFRSNRHRPRSAWEKVRGMTPTGNVSAMFSSKSFDRQPGVSMIRLPMDNAFSKADIGMVHCLSAAFGLKKVC